LNKITINKIKKICEEYDYINGIYPESKHEGKSLFEFICIKEKVKNSKQIINKYKYK